MAWILAAALVFTVLWSGSAGIEEAAGNEFATSNRVLAEYRLDGSEDAQPDVISFDVAVLSDDVLGAQRAFGIHLNTADDSNLFAGFEVIDDEKVATFVANLRFPDFQEAVGTPGPNGELSGQGISPVFRRIAVPFDWQTNDIHTFIIEMSGQTWTASVTAPGAEPTLIGTFEFGTGVSGLQPLVYTTSETVDFRSCAAERFVVAEFTQVSSWSAADPTPAAAKLRAGWVGSDSCLGSATNPTGKNSVEQELGGLDGFLGGPDGTGIELQGDFVNFLDATDTHPYCLVNLGENGGQLGVCFTNTDDREARVDQIIADEAQPRPSGETIWIGMWDEEPVKP